jgi:hypothetical protein
MLLLVLLVLLVLLHFGLTAATHCLQAPRDAGELLGVLGDTADAAYPIYRHGNSSVDSAVVTLCTALFDLEAGTLRVWTGNPGQASSRRLQLQLDLHTLRMLPTA